MNASLFLSRHPSPSLLEAVNYRKAIVREFAPFLGGKVIEVNAGRGLYTMEFPKTELLLLDPEETNVLHLRTQFPEAKVHCGTVADLDPNSFWNAIVSIHTLEHLEDDRGELSHYVQLLTNFGQKKNGYLCLFVTARPELESSIDQRLGIIRRYTKSELREKVGNAGFNILRMSYFNFAGYLGWWFYSRTFEDFPGRMITRCFDRLIFPPAHWLERRLCRPPLGTGLLVVAQPW